MFLSFLANSEVNSAYPVLAGHTIKGRDFKQKYLNKLLSTPQIVGVFLQDRVSQLFMHQINLKITQNFEQKYVVNLYLVFPQHQLATRC